MNHTAPTYDGGAAPAEEFTRFATMSRSEIVVNNKWLLQLKELAKTGVESCAVHLAES